MFHWASKSAISVEKGVFFRPKSAKRGCFSNLGTSVVYALVGSGEPGVPEPIYGTVAAAAHVLEPICQLAHAMTRGSTCLLKN